MTTQQTPATKETTMTQKNAIAGNGQHSHLVPSVEGCVVSMRDHGHEGTEIYRLADNKGFRFVSLDSKEVRTAERCVLVQLTDVAIEDVVDQNPYGCDLDSPDGLTLVGVDAEESVDGVILWDSATLT
jgi:uncharacterized ferredoxin-like protein